MSHFSGIYGHESVKKLLETAVKTGRISHAYIFCGPLGVGDIPLQGRLAADAVKTDLKQHPDIITVTNSLYELRVNRFYISGYCERNEERYIYKAIQC